MLNKYLSAINNFIYQIFIEVETLHTGGETAVWRLQV